MWFTECQYDRLGVNFGLTRLPLSLFHDLLEAFFHLNSLLWAQWKGQPIASQFLIKLQHSI